MIESYLDLLQDNILTEQRVIPDNHWILKSPIAHRGLWNNKYPELSMGSFQNAISKNIILEIDLNLTSDGEVVVFHDPNLKRMCGINKTLSSLTLEEVKQCRLLKTDYDIPTLKETLDFVRGRVPICVDIKSEGAHVNPAALISKTTEIMKGYTGKWIVMAFDPRILRKFASAFPNVLRLCHISVTHKKFHFKGENEVLKFYIYSKASKADVIGMDVDIIPSDIYEAAKKGGYPIIGWTIDSSKKLQIAKKYCDNFIFETISV